jgi:hypothetical protein
MTQAKKSLERENFRRVVSLLKKQGLHEAPSFQKTKRALSKVADPDLVHFLSEYPNSDEFESLLYLYWET